MPAAVLEDRGPSIPPEQLFLAPIGGYLLGIPSERKLVMELQCNMALRWFVGLNLDQDAWDASTFSQNRRRRFDASGVLEKLFDETVKRAMAEGLVSRHVSADGTLVRANASYKSFVPIEVTMDPDEYKKRLRAQDQDDEDGPDDPGNRAVDFRGEKRSNQTHRSATDTDCRFASKGSTGTGAVPGYTVNALMENRNRILMGIGVEIFRSSASETEGCTSLLDRAKRRLALRPRPSEPTRATSASGSSRRRSTVGSSHTSRLRPAGAGSPMHASACESAAPASNSRSAAARRSRSCSAKRRTGTGCDDSGDGVCNGFARRH